MMEYEPEEFNFDFNNEATTYCVSPGITQYNAPISAWYSINGHLLYLTAGDIVRLDSDGVPYIDKTL